MEERSTLGQGLWSGQPDGASEENQVLVCGQEFDAPGILRAVANRAFDPNFAGVCRNQARADPKERGLARAILSNEGDRLPGMDIKGCKMRRMSRQEHVNTVDASRNSPVASKEPHTA